MVSDRGERGDPAAGTPEQLDLRIVIRSSRDQRI
jgi:hypothetical protein